MKTIAVAYVISAIVASAQSGVREGNILGVDPRSLTPPNWNVPTGPAYAHPIRLIAAETVDLNPLFTHWKNSTRMPKEFPGWRFKRGEIRLVRDHDLFIQTFDYDQHRNEIWGANVFLTNYPNFLSCRDKDRIEFFAKDCGNVRYRDRENIQRTVALYDYGKPFDGAISLPSPRVTGGQGQTSSGSTAFASSTLARDNPYYGASPASVPFEFPGDPAALVQSRYVYGSPGAVSYRYNGDPSDLVLPAKIR